MSPVPKGPTVCTPSSFSSQYITVNNADRGTVQRDAAIPVKTANLIKFDGSELYHPSDDLFKYSLTLEVRDPAVVVPNL